MVEAAVPPAGLTAAAPREGVPGGTSDWGWLAGAGLGVLYGLAAYATFTWQAMAEGIPVFAPVGGVAVGVLLISARRRWPWLLLVAGVVNVTVGLAVTPEAGPGAHTVGAILTIAGLKVLEPLGTAVVLRRWFPGMAMEGPTDVLVIAVVAVAACAVTDLVLALALVWTGDQPASDGFTVWSLAVVGNAIGLVNGAALFLGLRSGLQRRTWQGWARLAVTIAGFGALTGIATWSQEALPWALPYLPFALALLVALVDGPPAASACVYVLALVTGRAGAVGVGLFGQLEMTEVERVAGMQAYVAVTTVTVLCSAAVKAQWNRSLLGLEGVVERRTEELGASRERYRQLVEGSRDIFYRATLDPFRMEYVSPQIATTLGVTPEEVYADPTLVFRLRSDEHDDPLTDLATWDLAPVQLRYRRRPDDQALWLEHRVNAQRDPATGRVVAIEGVARDITELKAVESVLAHRASHDPLTELPNRQVFFDRLDEARAAKARYGEAFAVMLFDLDRFKTVNDSLGHLAGDKLLTTLSRRVSHILRPSDTLARFGGDEFALIATHADRAGAEALASRILTTVREPTELEGEEVVPSVSIGIALGDEELGAIDHVRYADAALYAAKEHGRNQYQVFDDTLRHRIDERLHAERELRAAIAERQFVLEYQPEIDLDRGTISGVEALLRWQHPTRGLLLPAEFIPLAEETGLIDELGAWAFEAACAQLRDWLTITDRPLNVAVNLSAHQLANRNLAADLSATMARTGVDPHRLMVEVTETALLRQPDDIAAQLHHLRGAGLTIAIDDFGTGYSSLTHLQRLPIDTLKIDSAFVAAIDTTTSDAAIVEAILGLANALDLSVVAEGVETDRQLDVLCELGCSSAQGYLFDRPQPPEAITAVLRRPPLDATGRLGSRLDDRDPSRAGMQ